MNKTNLKLLTFSFVIIAASIVLYTYQNKNTTQTEYPLKIISLVPNKTWKWEILKKHIMTNCQSVSEEDAKTDTKNDLQNLLKIMSTQNGLEDKKIVVIDLRLPDQPTETQKNVCKIHVTSSNNKNYVTFTTKTKTTYSFLTNEEVYLETTSQKKN